MIRMWILQLWAIVSKNLRVLARSTSSSLAILLGPLLVILIVGAVFSSTGSSQVSLGFVPANFSGFSSYEQSLSSEFFLVRYSDESSCIDAVRRSQVSGCVGFSSDRSATIFVDPTDTAVVYTIIDQITGRLDEQSGALRSGLADVLLGGVDDASSVFASDSQRLSQIASSLQELEDQLSSIELSSVDVSFDERELQLAVASVFSARDSFESIAVDASEDYRRLAARFDDNSSRDEAEEYLSALEDIDSDDDVLTNLLSVVSSANNQISSVNSDVSQTSDSLNDVSSKLSELSSSVSAVASRAASQSDSLDGLGVDSSDIVSPLTTSVEPIVASDSPVYSLFPLFVTLLVMFTTMLLSSSLVMAERRSRAYFRNFITPTPDWLFILATYVTSVVVVLLQVSVLFVVLALVSPLSFGSSLLFSVALLFSVITFFSFLGMLLGYVFRTHEGVMLSALSLSSLFLLLSDIVLTVGSLPWLLQVLIRANPFVLSSEMLTGVFVFSFAFSDVLLWFSILVLYALILFAAIMILQRVTRVAYFESSKTASRVSSFLGDSEIPPGKELHVGDFVVNSKQSLLRVLVSLSDEEYEEFADHQRNVFSDWVLDVYKDDRLARLLRNTSRSGAITVLREELR